MIKACIFTDHTVKLRRFTPSHGGYGARAIWYKSGLQGEVQK